MFFGYYFTCCFVVIVASLIGMVTGSLTFILGQRKVRLSILVGAGTSFLIISGICGYWGFIAPNDFYHYSGDFDYYRMPLDYPYELSMIDMIDCADIKRWQEDELLVTSITHYHKRNNIIVGKISAECFFLDESKWFSFDTKTGKTIEYETESEFDQALKELGFSGRPELLTIEENWDFYWGGH